MQAHFAPRSNVYHYAASSSPYQITIGRFNRGGHVKMRRGRREARSSQNDREAFALLVFCIEFRLFGQALEWEYGRSDDRSGSENLTAQCYRYPCAWSEKSRA
jgi:hypothetical protein